MTEHDRTNCTDADCHLHQGTNINTGIRAHHWVHPPNVSTVLSKQVTPSAQHQCVPTISPEQSQDQTELTTGCHGTLSKTRNKTQRDCPEWLTADTATNSTKHNTPLPLLAPVISSPSPSHKHASNLECTPKAALDGNAKGSQRIKFL